MRVAALCRRFPLPAALAGAAAALVLVPTAAVAGPQQPSSVSLTSATQTSINLAWKSPSDPSVTGFVLFLDGPRVALVSSTNYSFTGLSCGKTYTIGVASLSGETHSMVVSVSAPTAPCPAPARAPAAPTPAPPPAPTTPPVTAQPVTTQPVTTQPVTAQRSMPQPTTTTEAASTEPTTTEPTTTEPTTTQQGHGKPVPPPPGKKDTVPPTAPTGLAVATTGGTSLGFKWAAATDNIGVAGYGVSLNGGSLGQTGATSFTAMALACATTYSFSVYAYDATGNKSVPATISAATGKCSGTPPPIPVAGYVSPSGSDSNPCTSTAPCLTLDRAYHAVQPGQIVYLAGGSYGGQSLTRDASKVSAPANVTFMALPGQLAYLAGVTLNDVHHVTFVGNSTGDLSAPGSGITLKASPSSMNAGADFTAAMCSSYVYVKNVDMRQLHVNGSDHITIDGGTAGGYDNTSSDSHVTGPYQGRGSSTCSAENPFGILITNVLFHDAQRTNAPNAHPDCLQFLGTSGTVLDSNRFVNCATSDIMARPATGVWSGMVLTNLVIQNNSFTVPTDGGGVIGIGAATDSCGAISLVNNTSTGSLGAFGCGSFQSLRVTGNRMQAMPSFTCLTVLARIPNIVFDSNYFKVPPVCGTNGIIG